MELTGIEISPSAIQAATLSAQVLGLNNVKFQSLDAANFALTQDENKPDLVIDTNFVEHFIKYRCVLIAATPRSVLYAGTYQII